MDAKTGAKRTFGSDPSAFEGLGAPTISALVAASADVAVILDEAHVIREVAVSDPDLPGDVFEDWIGREFADTVTVESRPKLDRLLANVHTASLNLHTHVNHTREGGDDVPIRYCAVSLNAERTIAVGKDLSPLASAQRRLINAQRNAEREVARANANEARFRQYFQQCDEVVIFLDRNDRIVEGNHAAVQRWPNAGRISGRRLIDLVSVADRGTLADALRGAREEGRATSRRLRTADVFIAPLRHNPGGLLVRIVEDAALEEARRDELASVIEAMPEAFVLTDGQFKVLTANKAFVTLTSNVSEEHVTGEPLESWLGRPGVDLPIMRSALADAKSLRAYGTTMRGDLGQTTNVEVSAAMVEGSERDYVGFCIRMASAPEAVWSPRSAQHLADLVGRVPLKEIVRETTDTIERLCIEGALELSNDNRASAAELLGLSRQSLYVKMRRYGIVDADAHESEV